MSVWSDLVAALPAWLVSVGTVSSTADVYYGRRAQSVRRDREVWLEYEAEEPAGLGFHGVQRYAMFFHVFVSPRNLGPAGTGALQSSTLEGLLDTLVAALHARTVLGSTITGMIHTEAAIADIDVAPTETRWLESTVRAVWTVAQ